MPDTITKIVEEIEFNKHDMGEMGEFIRLEYVKNILSKALTTLRTETIEEILGEVEKMRIECPNHSEEAKEEKVECYGYDEQHNALLSTLKQSLLKLKE